MSIIYPTLLAGLTPAATAEDVIDADAVTSLADIGAGIGLVHIDADGTYSVSGDDGNLPEHFFVVRLFDDSVGDWHAQSPFRVFLGGTVRVPMLTGSQEDVAAACAALGLTVNLTLDHSDTVPEGEIISANFTEHDLIRPSQVIELVVSSDAPALYAVQYAKLLPSGALASEPDSTLNALWQGVTGEFERAYSRTDDLLVEAQPSSTDELLDAWEVEYDLPSDCITIAQTEADRRDAVVGAFSGVGGQSVDYFKDLATRMGITIDIVEEHPFEVGRDGAGMGIGDNTWAFTWSVYAPIATSSAKRELMECVFERLKPAHTAVQFYYEQ